MSVSDDENPSDIPNDYIATFTNIDNDSNHFNRRRKFSLHIPQPISNDHTTIMVDSITHHDASGSVNPAVKVNQNSLKPISNDGTTIEVISRADNYSVDIISVDVDHLKNCYRIEFYCLMDDK